MRYGGGYSGGVGARALLVGGLEPALPLICFCLSDGCVDDVGIVVELEFYTG